jgi:hypothetical protein
MSCLVEKPPRRLYCPVCSRTSRRNHAGRVAWPILGVLRSFWWRPVALTWQREPAGNRKSYGSIGTFGGGQPISPTSALSCCSSFGIHTLALHFRTGGARLLQQISSAPPARIADTARPTRKGRALIARGRLATSPSSRVSHQASIAPLAFYSFPHYGPMNAGLNDCRVAERLESSRNSDQTGDVSRRSSSASDITVTRSR